MNYIEFPNLWNLKITVSPIAFSLFNINVFWYGIIIAGAFLLSVLLAMRYSGKFGIDSENVIDFILFAGPVAVICARLYYVIFNWEQFSGNPLSIINIRTGGLAIYGGIIGGVLVAYLFTKAKKIKFFQFADFIIVYLVLGQAIGRWGNFFNQEAFGINTALPWGMTGDIIKGRLMDLVLMGYPVDPNLNVHPTFLYESLWNVIIFVVLITFRKRKKVDGEVLSLYMMLYGLGRFFIEGLRLDSLMFANFRVSQVLSAIIFIAFGMVFFMMRKKSHHITEETLSEVLGDEKDEKAGG